MKPPLLSLLPLLPSAAKSEEQEEQLMQLMQRLSDIDSLKEQLVSEKEAHEAAILHLTEESASQRQK